MLKRNPDAFEASRSFAEKLNAVWITNWCRDDGFLCIQEAFGKDNVIIDERAFDHKGCELGALVGIYIKKRAHNSKNLKKWHRLMDKCTRTDDCCKCEVKDLFSIY